MVGSTNTRSGAWPTVGAVFIARFLGGLLASLVLVFVGTGAFAAGIGITAWFLVVVVASSAASAAALQPVLRALAGLHISFSGAFAAFLLGSCASTLLRVLLEHQMSQLVTPSFALGASTSLAVGASLLSSLGLFVALAIEYLVVQSVAEADPPERRAQRRGRGLGAVFLPIWVLVLVAGVLAVRHSLAGGSTSSSDLRQTQQQLASYIRGQVGSRRLVSVSCASHSGDAPGFPDLFGASFADCTVTYADGSRSQWCAAIENHALFSEYEGRSACSGPGDVEPTT
jgi:hypothetical protein